jgi:hypothetical protein
MLQEFTILSKCLFLFIWPIGLPITSVWPMSCFVRRIGKNEIKNSLTFPGFPKNKKFPDFSRFSLAHFKFPDFSRFSWFPWPVGTLYYFCTPPRKCTYIRRQCHWIFGPPLLCCFDICNCNKNMYQLLKECELSRPLCC